MRTSGQCGLEGKRRQPLSALEARRLTQRTLRDWAATALRLRALGMDRPRWPDRATERGAETLCAD